MKRILSIMLLSLGLNMAYADDFKVLLVNDASLKYKNGKTVKVGDVFKSAEDINWQKEKQAVKAYNMTTKKQVMFLGKSIYLCTVAGVAGIEYRKHYLSLGRDTLLCILKVN